MMSYNVVPSIFEKVGRPAFILILTSHPDSHLKFNVHNVELQMVIYSLLTRIYKAGSWRSNFDKIPKPFVPFPPVLSVIPASGQRKCNLGSHLSSELLWRLGFDPEDPTEALSVSIPGSFASVRQGRRVNGPSAGWAVGESERLLLFLLVVMLVFVFVLVLVLLLLLLVFVVVVMMVLTMPGRAGLFSKTSQRRQRCWQHICLQGRLFFT